MLFVVVDVITPSSSTDNSSLATGDNMDMGLNMTKPVKDGNNSNVIAPIKVYKSYLHYFMKANKITF